MPAKKTAGVAGQVNGVLYETTGNLTASSFKGIPVAP